MLGLSSYGYAKYCDFVLCNRFDKTFPNSPQIPLDIIFLKDGSRVFLNGENLKNRVFLSKLIKNFDKMRLKNLILFIHNIEPILPKNIIKSLIKFSSSIYLVNKSIEIEKDGKNIIYNLPIGIRDDEEYFSHHKYFSHKYIINERKNKRYRYILCYMCFTKNTYPDERELCEKILKNREFVINYNNRKFLEKQQSSLCGSVPLCINYEMTHKSKYVLCPRGIGVATHRFYESLYLGAIPIVKKENNVFDKLYNIFPCLIVNNWEDVTEKLLIESYDNLNKKLIDFNKKYPNWCENPETLINILSNS